MLKEWLFLKKMCQMEVHRFRTPAAAASRPALRVLKSKGEVDGSRRTKTGGSVSTRFEGTEILPGIHRHRGRHLGGSVSTRFEGTEIRAGA